MKSKQSFYSGFCFSLAIILLIGCKKEKSPMTDNTTPGNYKLAMVQMAVEPGKLEINLDRAVNRIAEAAANGAQIALLPEAMDLGWTDPSAKTMAFAIPDGLTSRRLRNAALKNNI